MMRSISRGSSLWAKVWPLLVWLGVWQLGSMAIQQEILLASPTAVARALGRLCGTALFWQSIAGSFGRISLGFLLAMAAGGLLAAASHRFPLVETLFRPLMTGIKSTPVASFVILALVWIKAQNLSVFISFLMAFPIAYTNLLAGLRAVDPKLLEMAKVFRVGWMRQFLYLYLPQLWPFLVSAATLSLGLSWKSGVAAEVIGLPRGSIGEQLYQAKIFLATDELFAWTLVVILISMAAEKLLLALLRRAGRRIGGAA